MTREDLWNYDRCRDRIASLRGRLGFPDSPCLEFLQLRLDLRSGILTTLPDGAPVPLLHAAVYCILATYSQATESPEVFRQVTFRDLPGGPAYDAAFRTRAILPLADMYSRVPHAFCTAIQEMGGIPVTFAEHAWKLYALPSSQFIFPWGTNPMNSRHRPPCSSMHRFRHTWRPKPPPCPGNW